MKKKILSLFLALTLCLSLLPTAAFAEGDTQDPAEPGEELLVPEQPEEPEDDPAPEQEEQQEDSASKQAVADVQALIDALPDASELDGMDDADAMAVYEAFQAVCDAYYDLTKEQQAQLKNTEKLEALSKWFSQSAALAAGTEHQHPICGETDCTVPSHALSSGETWQGVDTLTAEMEAGHYFLTDHVTIHSTWKPKGGVVLCLNGYGITLDADGPAIQVQPGVTFTLCDCSSRGEGSIRHSGGNNEKYGVGVLVGALDNLDKTAEFNMYGGTISYNTSISDGKVEGGGVTVAGGMFNMYGGTISDNKSLSGKGIGGGVFIANHGTFNMSGGEITQNGAKIGGGVFVGGYYGANTTEKENDANYGGTFHMSGGSITGNTAGGGVYVNYYPTTFTVSGTAQITGNRYAGETRNVYLSKGTIGSNVTYANPIEVRTLDSSASIGVTTAEVEQTVATGVSRAAKGCITSDNSKKYRLQYDSDAQTLTMIAVTDHTAHPICGASCTHDGTHTGESWTGISDLSAIKDNGNYYLTDNVKLTASWTSGSYNGRNVKLCLNGFDIIANVDDSAIKLNTYDGNTLTLCDCVGSGEITHGVKADGSKYIGAGVEVPGKQIFNMYGGTITGNKNTFGGVRLGTGATFNMYGGTITRNKANNDNGGGVNVAGGATFNMHGGSITKNDAANGGGVCAKGISSIDSYANFNMYGGTITENTATTRGGGVYVDVGTFKMSGGSITENTAKTAGGVYYSASNSLFVSGKVNITGNKDTDDNNNNVYVPSSSGTPKTVPFYIGQDGLAEEARIGVRVNDGVIGTGEHSPVAQFAPQANMTSAYREGNFIPDNGGVYGFKMEAREHDTLTSTHVVNLYNGLPHQHPICGKTCTHAGDEKHTDVTWTLLTSENGEPSAGGTALKEGSFNETKGYVLSAGHYYLSDTLNLNRPLLIQAGVYLCLNGQTLTVQSGNSAVIIDTGCDLTLCDCSEEQPGKITHATGATGCGVYMGTSTGTANSYNGVFTMYGGSITGNKRESGGGVHLEGKGTFNMHGGSITGNSANGGGSGVWVSGGTFNMSGGSITGNTVTGSTNAGGGVYVQGGTFNMSGDAVISNNNANAGGGVYVGSSGKFDMSGNAAITGNTVSANGGGVYVYANTASTTAAFTMSGNASISGNSANTNGGGVRVSGYVSFTMTGGSITGNNVNTYGGGVYVQGNDAKMTVSGNVQIRGNWKGGTKNAEGTAYVQGDGSANNFYLFGTEDGKQQQTITIGGDLTGAKIGVTTCLTPTAEKPIQIATGAQDGVDYTEIFTPDVTDYTVTKDGTTLYLSAHEHHWKYEKAASGEEIMVSCDADGCDLNGQKIYYTLRAPATSTLTYDGNGKPARVIVTGAPANVTTPQPSAISYMQTQPTQLTLENGAEPTNAGTYYASVTVGTETATVKYTIAPARLLITAKSTVIDYGSEPVNDGVDYQGFVNGETESVLIGELEFEHEYTQYGKVGDYDITPKGLTSRNYDITFLPGKLQVKPRPIIVTVNEVSREYGAANPELAYTASRPVAAEQAVVNGDDLGLTLSTTATAASPVDDYDVTCNTDYNSNYSITFDGTGKLKVTPKKITVTADNKSSRVGQPIVPLTYTYTPELIGSDEFNGELATNANKDTAGTYDITQDTLTLGDNYNIDFVSGTYTVQDKMPQDDFKFADVVGGKVTKTYGDPDFKFEATGQVADSKEVLYFSSAPEVATVRSDGTVHILKVSTTPITITATASATDDYAQGVATYELTVSPKELKATDLVATGSLTKTYDGTTTATGITVSVKDGVLVNGDQQPTITGSAKYNSKDVATANTITFTPNAITEGNYRLAATETVTITGAKINRRTITIRSVQVQPKQYDGDANGWSCITGVTFDGLVGSETLTKSTDYGITEATFNSANVNEANKITGKVGIINPNLNYIFKNADGTETGNASFEQACTITPRNSWALTPVNDLTIRYNNRDPQTYTPNWSTLLPSGQTWTYNSDNTVCTGSANLSTNTIGADTGVLGYQLSDGAENDTVTWTITASCGNYQTFTLTVTLTLIARDPQTNFKFGNNTTSVTKTYGDGDFTIKATGEETGSNVTYTSDDETVAKVDKDGKVTIVGAGTATIKAKASETVDFDEKVISYTLTVKKLRIHVPTPGKNELVYTGEEQTYMPDGLNTTYCEISRNKAKDVIDGDNWKTADVTLRDPRNTEWDEGVNNTTPKEYRFRITPKPITVKALDKKITTGQSAPALTNAKLGEDYTITGLIGSDSLGSIVLYYADPANTAATVMPDTGKAGMYAIVAKLGGGTSNPNYAPMFVSGTLTIANRPSSGGSYTPTYPVNTPSKTENGSISSNVKNASKGDTVTITVKPDSGYVLDDLTVTDKNGNELKLTDKGNGKYTFTMPAGKVEVKASFAEEIETSPFADVAIDDYYYEAVKWAVKNGITTGVGNDLFAPGQPCTRAQIVTFLWRAAGSPEPKGTAAGMTDVVSGSYYEKAVAWAIENGVTTGTTATTFSPDATCTRAQAVTFLFRAYKASADGMPAFRDVAANAYYAEAVKWATDNGITNGIGGGLFGPDNDCTRAQIVTFLWRLYAGK